MKRARNNYGSVNWKPSYAALRACSSITLWFDAEMSWYAEARGKPGRSRKFSDPAIQVCLSLKYLINLPLRQAMDMTQSLLRLAGFGWLVPDFSTISRRQKSLEETIGTVKPCTGLNVFVDDSGVRVVREYNWKTRKFTARCRRRWRTVRITIDTVTLEIRAVLLTDSNVEEPPVRLDGIDHYPVETSSSSYSRQAEKTEIFSQSIVLRQAQIII